MLSPLNKLVALAFAEFPLGADRAPPKKPEFADPTDPNKLPLLFTPNGDPAKAGLVLSSDEARGFEVAGLISAVFGISWLFGDGADWVVGAVDLPKRP